MDDVRRGARGLMPEATGDLARTVDPTEIENMARFAAVFRRKWDASRAM